jgi:hypothetical protein
MHGSLRACDCLPIHPRGEGFGVAITTRTLDRVADRTLTLTLSPLRWARANGWLGFALAVTDRASVRYTTDCQFPAKGRTKQSPILHSEMRCYIGKLRRFSVHETVG